MLDGSASTDDIAVLLMRRKPTDTSAFLQDVPLTKRWRFHSSHAQSAQASRHELMTFIRKHAANDDELLANTVEHAPGLVEIAIDRTDVQRRLTICDSGGGLKTTNPELLSGDLSEDGRGLYLIRELSSRFAIRQAMAFGMELEVDLPIVRGISYSATTAAT